MTSHINVYSGVDYTIAQLAEIIARVVNYTGEITSSERPDGTPEKF